MKKVLVPEPQKEKDRRAVLPGSFVDNLTVGQLADYAIADLVKANPLTPERGDITLFRVVDFHGRRYRMRIKLTAVDIGQSPSG